MSEENNNRTVKATLDRKFGVSERFERKPREDGERKSFGNRNGFRKDRFGGKSNSESNERRSRSFGDGERKSFGNRDGFRKDRFGGRGNGRFNRDRRPFESRDFKSDKGETDFRSHKEFSNVSAPIYRQRPEQKDETTEDVVTESALEARVNAAESSEDEFNPPWFKKAIALTTEKGRAREGNFLGEGLHVVQELVSHHSELVQSVYVVENFGEDALIESINEAGIRLNVLSAEQMKRLSTTVTPQGIVAVARIASKKPAYESSRSVLTLVDAVQDPGNLGTLFRTSLGFNSDGMVLGRGTVSPFNPKVVRGSSGTFLRVPFEFDIDLVDHINFLRSKGYTIIATDLHAKQSLREIPQQKLRKMAFLVGNEGAGTNPYFIELADETVKIPMSSELESLNVAVAHGILSYEAAQIQEELK